MLMLSAAKEPLPSLDCTERLSAGKLGYEDYRTVTRNQGELWDAMGTRISNRTTTSPEGPAFGSG
jgi:hypothetical protein